MTVAASPVGLDSDQRTRLERLVIRSRALLEDDLRAQAEGRFGIHADGTIELLDEEELDESPIARITVQRPETPPPDVLRDDEVMDPICDDLLAEHADLDALVAVLSEEQWSTPTPAAGWTVRDQISHLWFFDQRALLALTDPEEFAADTARLFAAGGTAASVEPGRAISMSFGLETRHGWKPCVGWRLSSPCSGGVIRAVHRRARRRSSVSRRGAASG